MKKQKFVTEKLGGCWHEVKDAAPYNHYGDNPPELYCTCGVDIDPHLCENLNLTTWEGFGWMFEKMQARGDWDLFMCNLYYHEYMMSKAYNFGDEKNDNDGYLHEEYINPTNFLEAVAEFLGYEEEE